MPGKGRGNGMGEGFWPTHLFLGPVGPNLVFPFLEFKPFEKRYTSVFVYQEISVPTGLPLGEARLPYSLCPAAVVRGGVWRGVREQRGQCQVHSPGSKGCLWL